MIDQSNDMSKLKEQTIGNIIILLKKYTVNEAYLFGSFISQDYYNDIDIGVDMSNKEEFFSLYSDLIDRFDDEIDLVLLNNHNKFVDIVKRDGLKIYG